VRFLGYRVESYKLFVFTLSACMAGVAGALYVPQVGIINPSEFAPGNSIEAVIWVAVGGRGTLIGAAVGAVLVNYAKTTFTSGNLAPYWLFGALTLATLAAVALKRPMVLVAAWLFGTLTLATLAAVAFKRPMVLVAALAGAALAALTWALPLMITLPPPLLPYVSPFGVAAVLCLIWLGSGAHPIPLGIGLGALAFAFFITPDQTIGLAPYWLFALGGMFVLVTLLMPDGVVGAFAQWWNALRRWWRRDNGAPAGVAEPRPAE
jgi:ABC-type branched-subunit amino acid transport system permease subunit